MLAAISGPMPNAAMRPTAPGSAATHCVTTIIQSMPTPMIAQNTPSKPNGMATQAEQPRRHHQRRDHRHRREIGEHAIGRDAVEVKGGVRRGGEPRHQRGQQQHHDLAAAPQRHARGRGMIGRREQARHADLHQRHQPKRRRKRHLKAWMRVSKCLCHRHLNRPFEASVRDFVRDFATRSTAAATSSSRTWAYRSVVLMSAWFSAFCTSLRLPVSRSSLVPKSCRKSWKRKSLTPALARIRCHADLAPLMVSG